MFVATAVLLFSLQSAQTPLKLTVPATHDVTAASWCPDVPVGVGRPDKVEGVVVWTVRAPEGVQASVVPGEGDSARIALRGFCDSKPGESVIAVEARLGALRGSATVKLVRGQAKVLLVDDDRSSNNGKSPSTALSASDKLFRQLLLEGDGLRSLVYDSLAIEQYSDGPPLETMQRYDTIVWYTGGQYGGNPGGSAVVSDKDIENLRAWMAKGKTAILFSAGTINNLQGYVKPTRGNEEKWVKAVSPFLLENVGIQGAQGLLHRYNEIDVTNEDGSVTFHLEKGKPIETQVSPLNPSKAVPLLWVELNPDNKGVRRVPCAVANVTDVGSVVFVGFSFENISGRVGEAFRMMVAPALGWGEAPRGGQPTLGGPAGRSDR